MKKHVLLCYHKNAHLLYPKAWIDDYRASILNQTNDDFTIFEVNYGGDDYRIFNNSRFVSHRFSNFVEAMNWMLDTAFVVHGCHYAFNTNVDDWYALDRIDKQLHYLRKGYDVVTSNFTLINEDNNATRQHQFHNLDIAAELAAGHNIIGHPVVAYSRHFWQWNRYHPHEVPYEDLKLWQRAIEHHPFIILPDQLLFHRLHGNSVCQSTNR